MSLSSEEFIEELEALPRDPDNPAVLFEGQIKAIIKEFMRESGCCDECMAKAGFS